MSLNYEEAYNKHFQNYIIDFFLNFETDFSHAPNKAYFITVLQSKSIKLKSELQIRIKYTKNPVIDNKLDLDDRISRVELVDQFCKKENRNFIKTLFQIAETKALNEIWFIAEGKRKLINKESNIKSDLPVDSPESTPIQIIETNINDRSDTSIQLNEAAKNSNTVSPILIDIFSDKTKYAFIIKQLIEFDFCKDNPLIWIPQGKGNKLILCTLLYVLYRRDYFNLTNYPTQEFLREIALNTFEVDISLSTFKKLNINTYIKEFEFIKPASEIN